MLVSDHPHLFETGGENYHCEFTAWDYVRGHEGDPWRTHRDPTWAGTPALPAGTRGWFWNRSRPDSIGEFAYDRSRTFFRAETDFPGPRTMTAAADWIRNGALHHDRWLLFVDEFDPHEPFDTPAPWVGRYDPDWDDELIIWPPYDIGAVTQGRMSEREARHIRANYGAKLSMIDHWFGEIVRALDERALWDTTAVIVCTDHGHYLGERRGPGGVDAPDIWGKPGVMQYEPLGHMPLLIHWPGVPSAAGTTCDALTTAVDLHATIADAFGVDGAASQPIAHGRSLRPLLDGRATSVREWAIGGVYGNWVQVTDGRRKYARGAVGDNFPLSMWSNRWSTMPVHGVDEALLLPRPDRRAELDFLPGCDVPVIRQPFAPGDRVPFWVGRACVDAHHLFDVDDDPDEAEDLVGTRAERDMIDLLRAALDELHAPDDQYARLGLT